jgi:hypothetical protein
MEIQMTKERRNDRKVIPLHTGKVAIGIAWQPKPTIHQAQCIEVYTRPSYVGRWLAVAGLAGLAMFLIVRVAA